MNQFYSDCMSVSDRQVTAVGFRSTVWMRRLFLALVSDVSIKVSVQYEMYLALVLSVADIV